jgi:hypothetical protein
MRDLQTAIISNVSDNPQFESYAREAIGWFELATKHLDDKDVVRVCLLHCRNWINRAVGGIPPLLTYPSAEAIIERFKAAAPPLVQVEQL